MAGAVWGRILGICTLSSGGLRGFLRQLGKGFSLCITPMRTPLYSWERLRYKFVRFLVSDSFGGSSLAFSSTLEKRKGGDPINSQSQKGAFNQAS